MKKIFALLVVAVLFVACGDESSSSAPATDPSEESSSPVEKTTESSSSVKPTSSEDKQSSSTKKDGSSSSVVKSSSSATPKSSSSEEVKQSSSSVVTSSSSEYVPYNHLTNMGSTVVSKSEYKQFTDTRNGRSYYYLTINGVDKNNKPASITVMTENLNIGVMVDGEEDQNNDSEIERYCYDNDTTNCDKYGGLYQWAEMMQLPSGCNTKSCANLIKPNHQGICPNGWRLLTEDDFYVVLHADRNKHGAEDVRATSFGGYNYSGYSMIGGGYNWNHEFDELNDGTYWLYPAESNKYPDEGAYAGSTTRSLTTASRQAVYKTYGFSVRCVMVE